MLRRHTRVAILVVVLVFFTASTTFVALAKEDPFVYFPETGHLLRQPFLAYFKATGGLTRYGYPITDDFVDPKTGLLVQYFQKGRLEWHPTNPDPYKIQLGLLNEEMGKRTPPMPVKDIPVNDPNCAYFPETGHSVCYKFLEYWLKAGGLDMFGYPISEFVNEDDLIVQYFQRAKIEWYPSRLPGQQIQLTNIGDLYARTGAVPPSELSPKPPPSEIQGKPIRIVARASTLNAVIKPGGLQSVYVLVVDQLGQPVPEAAVSLIVNYPQPQSKNIDKVTYQLTPTNQDGMSFQTFPAGNAPDGTVINIEFIVTYPGVATFRAPTSYMIFGK